MPCTSRFPIGTGSGPNVSDCSDAPERRRDRDETALEVDARILRYRDPLAGEDRDRRRDDIGEVGVAVAVVSLVGTYLGRPALFRLLELQLRPSESFDEVADRRRRRLEIDG
jgi:hypothetical protein